MFWNVNLRLSLISILFTNLFCFTMQIWLIAYSFVTSRSLQYSIVNKCSFLEFDNDIVENIINIYFKKTIMLWIQQFIHYLYSLFYTIMISDFQNFKCFTFPSHIYIIFLNYSTSHSIKVTNRLLKKIAYTEVKLVINLLGEISLNIYSILIYKRVYVFSKYS